MLRTRDAIIAEKSGFEFERGFYTGKDGYIEAVTVAENGKILLGESISLSEEGIRIYPDYSGHPTKNTTLINK